MTGQLLLFKASEPKPAAIRPMPLSHRDDPATSREAADRLVKSGKLHGQRKDVFEALQHCDGATHAELGEFMGIDWLVCVRRLPEPEKAGLIRKSEPRECRLKGSRCCTWWIVDSE